MAQGSRYQSNRQNVRRALTDAEHRALEAIGQYVSGEAKLRSPVGQYDDGRVGGRLRDSIDYKVNGDSVVIGTNVEYAPYVEKGTSKMEAQPFLTPSAEENINNIKELFKRMLNLG